MQSRLPLISLLLVAGLLVLGPGAIPANAQSDNDLRRENQGLTTRVRDLTVELNAALDRIEELEAEIERLQAVLEASGPVRTGADAPAMEPERVTVDETVPHASPRALFAALQKSYVEAMGDQEQGELGSTTRANYLRALERWRASLTNKFRAPIEWHVRAVQPAEPTARGGFIVSLVAVDPVTDVELGLPFEVFLARSLARRLSAAEDRSELDKLLLKGVLVPAVWINPNRESPGVFDNPRLIGPYAEFGFRVEVRTLTVPPKQKETKDSDKEKSGEDGDG